MLVRLQGVSVAEQEQLDNAMIEMDGTENKCESGERDATRRSEFAEFSGMNADATRARPSQQLFGSKLTSLMNKRLRPFTGLNKLPTHHARRQSSQKLGGNDVRGK